MAITARRLILIAASVLLVFAVIAQTISNRRFEQRFAAFAGSDRNAASLVAGLRGGNKIMLKGSGEAVTFLSPVQLSAQDDITRTLDLARHQLAASGITAPTPKEIRASLVGGVVAGADGAVSYPGVLQMRAEGMAWDEIAHELGSNATRLTLAHPLRE